jgi:SAM-dependent methyltransferase
MSVDCTISNHDTMYIADVKNYLLAGLSAVQTINRVLSLVSLSKINSVLDFACGSGRVLRFLVKRFPDASFSACDTVKEMVDFCVERFGAKGYYSQPDFDSLSLGAEYDLIWCGSLVTHLTAKDIQKLLRFFERHLRPAGLAIVTLHGDHVAARLRAGHTCSLSPEFIQDLLKSYEQTGYGNAIYLGPERSCGAERSSLR